MIPASVFGKFSNMRQLSHFAVGVSSDLMPKSLSVVVIFLLLINLSNIFCGSILLMPRACTICAHNERNVIDALIADRQPYLQIASKFGLNQRTVNTHGKNHVLPFIADVERQAQVEILKRVQKYRDAVNMPLPEKSKYIEDKLWQEYDLIDDGVQKMVVMREINKQQAEQAKLTGAYIKEAANPTDVTSIALEIVDRLVKQGFEVEEARGMLYKLHPEFDVESKAVN